MKSVESKPEGYVSRIVDDQIAKYLTLFGAVEVSGTKWCGKTWSSLAHARSVTYVDRGANLEITKADPSYALVGNRPHVIDEWQRVPEIWDTVRHAVDSLSGERGAWILTGSSTPKKDETVHSGAGRIGRVRMHPMTLQETGESTGKVSLSALFDGQFEPCQCSTGIVELAQIACRGGWPESRDQEPEDAQIVVREYMEAIHSSSVVRLGGKESISRRLCASLARSLGHAAKAVTLAADVYALDRGERSSEAQRKEIAAHLDILARLYVLDEVSGWVPASRHPARMRTKPKRYFADPSIPVALLGLSPASLIQDWQTFGLVFENLCMRDLDVYARALDYGAGSPVRYYHDDSGLEADAIVERPDGKWAAFEFKLSSEKVEQGATSLKRLKSKVCENKAACFVAPTFMAVIIGVGEMAYRRPDGIYVIPIRALGV